MERPDQDLPEDFPSEEIIRQMLLNEARKLDLQERRFALEEANQARQHDYACRSLAVQREILNDRTRRQEKMLTRTAIVSFITISLVLGFFCFCIYSGEEGLVKMIIKAVGMGGLVFFSGVQFHKVRKMKRQNNDELSDEQVW